MRAVLDRMRRLFAAFRASQDGNVAMMFTLVMIPVIGLTGAAIDYTRASSARSAMQAALDATALAMSKEAASISDESVLNTKAQAYFNAAFTRPDAPGVVISAHYTTEDGSALNVSALGSIATSFMGILGINQIPIASTAKTVWGTGKVRVALVLDVSASMGSGGRMTALKSATKDLITKLENASSAPGDVQVAIVPFNKNVNAGPGNHTATWISWGDWDNRNGTCTNYSNWNGWGPPKKKSDCTSHSGTWTVAGHSTWDGCVMDRDQDYDVQKTTPDPNTAATLFPAQQYSDCPESVMSLNYNWTSLRSKVDALTPVGNTNQPIGLAWGWMALTQDAPMSAPPLPSGTTQHFIVLLSDGENTEDRWYDGWGAEANINARQTRICDNIKAANVQIYTVLLINGNESLMRSCASKSDMFFKLTTVDQVAGAFNAIGTQISKLRLAL
jgi:Flp pilus assembly protein TadG